jgi:hypothetical protein
MQHAVAGITPRCLRNAVIIVMIKHNGALHRRPLALDMCLSVVHQAVFWG